MQSTHTVSDPTALESYGTNRTTDVDTNTRSHSGRHTYTVSLAKA